MKEPLKDAIIRETDLINHKKKLSCPKAFKLAEKFGVGLKEIAEICEAEGIKIHSCQLGCF